MSVVGARPQFVKLAPIAKELDSRGIEHPIVHTGQHYDPALSDVFFRDLNIPDPKVHLGVGSNSHGAQTGEILAKMDAVLDDLHPDCVLVYGDTNSTLAAALSAVKLHYPVAHLEAGLRSFNRRMPEEHNRVLTDHAADLCLAPTRLAMENLANEGLSGRSVLVGDVMTDVLFQERDKILSQGGSNPFRERYPDGFYVATIHRAENTDDRQRLEMIIHALASAEKPVLLLAHPRLRARASEAGLVLNRGSIDVHEPLPYPELLAAVLASDGVVTDSGGLQKEAFLLNVPCTTIRTETEWIETIELGWNVLANSVDDIIRGLTREFPKLPVEAPYGRGDAAQKTVTSLIEYFS